MHFKFKFSLEKKENVPFTAWVKKKNSSRFYTHLNVAVLTYQLTVLNDTQISLSPLSVNPGSPFLILESQKNAAESGIVFLHGAVFKIHLLLDEEEGKEDQIHLEKKYVKKCIYFSTFTIIYFLTRVRK